MIMNEHFCRICGTVLEMRETEHEGVVPYCPVCDEFRFPQYNVAVSMIVVNEEADEILLIRQYGRPFYVLVAGYVNREEALEDAVRREIKEETGMTVRRICFNRTRFFEQSDTLMCNFTAFVRDASEIHVNYEVDSYAWFSKTDARKNIKPGSLAEFFLNSYLDSDEQIHRIGRYENMLDEAELLIRKRNRSEAESEKLQKLVEELESYYRSEEWKKDFEDDEKGLLPEVLKRGVLSEDGIYNLRDHSLKGEQCIV